MGATMGCAQKDDSVSRRFQMLKYLFGVCNDESLETVSWITPSKMQNCRREFVFYLLVLPQGLLGYDIQR
jgi:hypothetical protein